VRWWFSASDAEGADDFAELLRESAQQQLEAEGGVCIVATHLGKGYGIQGRVHEGARHALESLARKPGWFPTVGELLDWLRTQGRGGALPPREWRRMQWHWMRDLAARKVKHGWRRMWK
ncbi:MAG TPA: hypothetical protein VGP87_12635, partial [Gemmatimonadales bacterium]|nr:hypothetical protein [Gemmatimonadales bacterium]